MAEETGTVCEDDATVRDTGTAETHGGATVREGSAEARGGATVREGNAETRGGATVRENDARPRQAAGWLPAAIGARHRIIEALPARGGEADLYVVGALDPADGAKRRVAKVYRQGIDPKEEVLQRVRDADPRHVVQVEAHGQDGATGRWWELMEYVEHGSLRQLMEREGPALPVDVVMAILGELNDALGGLHGLDMEHRDLKPGNVLVRSRDPLQLVLTDFGITSVMSATVHFTNAARTVRYAPPEAASGVIEHTTYDYWSLGMMLVEMLTGAHPFAGLSEAIIGQRLATLNTEELVEGVSEPDWRKLCRGLLRRTPSVRWDAETVSRWMANPGDQSLEVAEDASGIGVRTDAPSTATIDFDGTSYSTPADLGAALARDWDKAASFWRRRLQDVRTWLADGLGLQQLDEAVAIIDDQETPLDVQVFSFVYLLGPNAPLRFRDQELSLQALGELGRRAGSGDAQAGERLRTLYRQRILSLAGSFPGGAELGRLSARWDEVVAGYARTRRRLAEEGVTVPEPTGEQLTLLLAASASDNPVAERLRERARSARTGAALHCPWFRDFGEPEDMSVAVLVMIPLVQAEAENRGRIPQQTEAAKRAAGRAAARARPAVAAAARRLVDYAGIITIVAIVLMVLGTVLAGFGVMPLGPGIKWLGDVAFRFGFTAFLYKGSRRRAVVFGAVGIGLLVLAFLAPTFLSNVSLGGPILNLPTYLVGSLWNLGVVVLMCGFVSFLLRESRYAKVLAVARPYASLWMAMIARQPLLIRAGAHSVTIGLILLALGFFMDVLLLGNSGFARLGGGLIGSGLLLVVIGFFWRP